MISTEGAHPAQFQVKDLLSLGSTCKRFHKLSPLERNRRRGGRGQEHEIHLARRATRESDASPHRGMPESHAVESFCEARLLSDQIDARAQEPFPVLFAARRDGCVPCLEHLSGNRGTRISRGSSLDVGECFPLSDGEFPERLWKNQRSGDLSSLFSLGPFPSIEDLSFQAVSGLPGALKACPSLTSLSTVTASGVGMPSHDFDEIWSRKGLQCVLSIRQLDACGGGLRKIELCGVSIQHRTSRAHRIQ